MDFPVFVGPMEKGRQILESLSPVKRPNFLQPDGPTCSGCGAAITDDLTEKMEVHGIEFCPVCVLTDVYTAAVPRKLGSVSSKSELGSMVENTFDSPPNQVTNQDKPMPGVYILWCPPLSEAQLREQYDSIQQLEGLFVKVLSAAAGNGLLYIGQSNDVVTRIWQHSRGGGALLTKIFNPSRLVAIKWLNPKSNLRELENQVGRRVAESVEESGYEIEVYWR